MRHSSISLTKLSLPTPPSAERLKLCAPGLALCALVSLAGAGLERIEALVLGRAWIDALVFAIVIGAVLRSCWRPGKTWSPGIQLAAKPLLELGVMLLGAAVDFTALAVVGPGLVAGVIGVVALAIAASWAIGRACGLPDRIAVLVACGNSICGNSAIVAVAPVIGADAAEVIASLGFTAVLGVAMVIALPLLVPALGLSATQYGVLAGLTVYSVPQVVAATAPIGALSVQVGTLVKLTRVVMLGPVVLALSLAGLRRRGSGSATGTCRAGWRSLVPAFVIGFVILAMLRSLRLLPELVGPPASACSGALTLVAMAALGLGVDVRAVAGAGLRTVAVVTASLAVLGSISYGLIALVGVK